MQPETSVSPSVKTQLDLSGRVAVITGGCGFLGVQFAEALAEMGAFPVLFDVGGDAMDKAVAQVSAQFGQCDAHALDITDKAALQAATDAVVAKHGHIDILVNAAGLTRYTCSAPPDRFFAAFENSDAEVWEAGLKVNLTGVALACQVIAPVMLRQGKGSIINIGSDVGVISPDHRIYEPDEYGYPGQEFNTPAFYAVTKAGVIHLTRYLATLWAKRGVRVNAFSPAGVYRNHDPAFVKKLAACIPMGRMAAINEYKGAIAFLASDASSFMTGHNLVMDGGRTCW
ncbi:MAG: short-chain dehydrogenase/reductase [Rhodospirillaceae bacterium]|nr:MAG: short-chain dehydrogenase/reductase [Rhodospirillaceae bacterium]TNC97419.1 MAG: short-chain dehydrogenase/reductase SDR [Stygiobacter sp.]